MPSARSAKLLSESEAAVDVSTGNDLPDRVTTLVHRIGARVAEVGNAEVRRFGFNVHGSRVLIALLEHGVHRVGELCTRVAIDASTMSYLLSRLQRDGLVRRTRQDADNRSVDVDLTPAGRVVAKACKNASLNIEAALLKNFTRAEVKIVRELLRRMCAVAERDLHVGKGSKRSI